MTFRIYVKNQTGLSLLETTFEEALEKIKA